MIILISLIYIGVILCCWNRVNQLEVEKKWNPQDCVRANVINISDAYRLDKNGRVEFQIRVINTSPIPIIVEDIRIKDVEVTKIIGKFVDGKENRVRNFNCEPRRSEISKKGADTFTMSVDLRDFVKGAAIITFVNPKVEVYVPHEKTATTVDLDNMSIFFIDDSV